MELLVTLRNPEYLDKLRNVCDGVVIGTYFSSGYNYKADDLALIKKYCDAYRLKLYVTIENFISEDEREILLDYLGLLAKLNVDGIYFHDLGVYQLGKELGLTSKLIYDGSTVMCNSLEATYYLNKGLGGVKISNELTIKEISNILTVNKEQCDLQVFGHLRMSYSKRKFLSNYFKQIDKPYNYFNSHSLYLIEEQRDYKMPIVEDESGTKIYTDYIFQMYRELPILRPYIKRGIIDTLFIDDERIIQVVRDYRRLTTDNYQFLYASLCKAYPDSYSTAYLYEKTNITKDE